MQAHQQVIPFIAERGGKDLKVHWLDASGKERSGKSLEFLQMVSAQAKEGKVVELKTFPPTADNEILYLRLAAEVSNVWHLRKRPQRATLPKVTADQLTWLVDQPDSEFVRYFPRSIEEFIARKGMSYFEIAQRHLRIGADHMLRPVREAFNQGFLLRNEDLQEVVGYLDEIVKLGQKLEDAVLRVVVRSAKQTPYWGFLMDQPGIGEKTAARIIAAGPIARFDRNGFEDMAGLVPESALKAGRQVSRTAHLFRAFLDWRRRLQQRSHEYNRELSPTEAKTLEGNLVSLLQQLPEKDFREQKVKLLGIFGQWGRMYEEVYLPYFRAKYPNQTLIASRLAAKSTARRFARWLFKEMRRLSAAAKAKVSATDGAAGEAK
jgi:hypothetical protein